MTYEWRLNIETNRWSYEEVDGPPTPDALREFKLRVMDALDREHALELRAFQLRQELHDELKVPSPFHVYGQTCEFSIEDLKDTPVTLSTDPGPWLAYSLRLTSSAPISTIASSLN